MKPDYKPLKELTDKVKKYKTKVKVLHKGYPQQSPKKGSRYQRLILEDEEGFTMKAALFNNDIEKYAEALQRKGEYELDDAAIKKVPQEYAARPNECSLVINNQVKINPLTTDPVAFAPEYQAIATIPRDPLETGVQDVLGIVLYVSEPRQVQHSSGRKDIVREVQIIDHSYDRPFSITLWNEIITVHEAILNSWADSFTVAGFCAITGKSFKGFTMSSTMSTAIVVNPQGGRADGLRQWAAKNKDRLIDHRSKLVELYSTTKKKVMTKIETINRKKAHETWQEELFIIRVTLPTASAEHMHLYLGCSRCNRKCTAELHSQITCQYCAANDAIAEPRVVLKIDAVDDTGSIQLPVFTKDVELLVGLSAPELWTLIQTNELDPIAEKMHALRSANILLTIGPTLGLTTSRVLSWAIRSIEFEAKESVDNDAIDDAQNDVPDIPATGNHATDTAQIDAPGVPPFENSSPADLESDFSIGPLSDQ